MKRTMRPLVPSLLALVLGAASLAVQTAEPVRLDGSSDQAAERSFKAMLDASPRATQRELAMAMLKLNMAGVSSASEMLADPELRNPSIKRIRRQVDGRTAKEIIALAKEDSSATVFLQGQEPGIPAELLAPLPQGPVSRSLVGTTWKITTDINGHISHSTVRLDPEGRAHTLDADVDSGATSAWEQSADELLLTLNDRFAVYRGRLDGEGLSGTGGNINGSTWSWTAEPFKPATVD